MAENLPRYAVTDLIARVSGMSRGRLEMRLLGECAEVSRFMPPQTAGEGDMAFLTNAAYAEAMKDAYHQRLTEFENKRTAMEKE